MRGVKKPNTLAVEYHKEIGEQLADMRAELNTMRVLFKNTYSKGTTDGITKDMLEISQLIFQLSCKLEKQLLKEYPGIDVRGIY